MLAPALQDSIKGIFYSLPGSEGLLLAFSKYDVRCVSKFHKYGYKSSSYIRFVIYIVAYMKIICKILGYLYLVESLP